MMRRLKPGPLVVATHNLGKLEEVRSLLAPHGFDITSNRDHNLPEPDETETTFAGNALIKAHAAAQALGVPALADDSGLCIDALDGAPGVYTADWAETETGRDFGKAMNRAYEALRDHPQPWTARFHSTLALAWPDGHFETVAGDAHGHLIWPIRGAAGHGYDPMFVPDGETLTFAEMSADQKNAISHRSRALAAFVAQLVDA